MACVEDGVHNDMWVVVDLGNARAEDGVVLDTRRARVSTLRPETARKYRSTMDREATVILARHGALRCVRGMPDTLTLRLEARVPPELRGRAVVVEQRLTRRDVARMLAAFAAGT